MRQYVAKRILFFVPSLVVLVIFCFILLRISPGHPLDHLTASSETSFTTTAFEKEQWEREKGILLPVFYCSVEPWSSSGFKKYIPAISFHRDNQFHRWFFGYENGRGIIRGDFGNSLITNEKVSRMIAPAFNYSLLMVLLSLLLAWIVSIPAGIKMAVQPNSFGTKTISVLLNILFSLPVFWIGMVLLFLFANPYVFNIFPSSSIGLESNEGFVKNFIHQIPYFILPVFCYAYGAFAFLSSSLASNMSSILQLDYIRTAYAKGLKEKTVIHKHAFRNALLPMITLFSHAFPAVIGGSVIIETIFSIPGMGSVIFHAIETKDYPVVISVFFLTGLITMITFLISDLLAAYLDPRIRFEKEELK